MQDSVEDDLPIWERVSNNLKEALLKIAEAQELLALSEKPVAPATTVAQAKARTMVGPFCLPTNSTVVMQPGVGAWAVNSKGALFVAACITEGATVANVLASAAKHNVTLAQAKAHLMWGYNQGWLTCTPAPANTPPLKAGKPHVFGEGYASGKPTSHQNVPTYSAPPCEPSISERPRRVPTHRQPAPFRRKRLTPYRFARVWVPEKEVVSPTGVGAERLVEIVTAIVQAEKPIHSEEIPRRVTEIFCLKRAGAQIQSAVAQALESAKRRGVLSRAGSFWACVPDEPITPRDRFDTHWVRAFAAQLSFRNMSSALQRE